ncbi:MAG: hypothetical protein ACM3VW_10315 [Bacteroidota bacterium]
MPTVGHLGERLGQLAQLLSEQFKRGLHPDRWLGGLVAFKADRCTIKGEQVVPQPGGFYGGWITSWSSARSREFPALWGGSRCRQPRLAVPRPAIVPIRRLQATMPNAWPPPVGQGSRSEVLVEKLADLHEVMSAGHGCYLRFNQQENT